MKGLTVLFAVVTVVIVSGCAPAPFSDEIVRSYTKPREQTVAPDLRHVAIVDLVHCSTSFCEKNGRWPENYAELQEFVKQSGGVLVLGEYDRVDLKPTWDDRLEIRCVLPGWKNEMVFMIEDHRSIDGAWKMSFAK